MLSYDQLRRPTFPTIMRFLFAAATTFTLAPVGRAQVITTTWTGASGNWVDPALWSSNPNYPNNDTPPGATYNAIVNGSGSIFLTTSITIDQLNFASGTVAALTSNPPRILTMNGPMTWSGGVFGGGGLVVNAYGGATLTTGRSDGPPINLRGSSTLSGGIGVFQLVNEGGATLTATGGAIDSAAGAAPTFVNRGTFRVTGDVRVVSTGSSGTIDVQSGTLSFVRPSGGGGGTADVTVSGPLTVATGTTVSVVAPGFLNVNGPGTLRGTGTIAGPATATLGNGASIAPGIGGPGVLHMTGPVAMTAGAILSADLNGAAPGTGYDRLDLTGGGSIALNGSSLQAQLGYAPTPTDALTILLGGPVSGTFASLPNGTQFSVGSFGGVNYVGTINYTPTSVVLSNLQPAPVPEPAAWLLAGVVAAAWQWRRRRP